MVKKTANYNLHSAKTAKTDEFYTQIADIERELNHYEKHLKGKVVFCNCSFGDTTIVAFSIAIKVFGF